MPSTYVLGVLLTYSPDSFSAVTDGFRTPVNFGTSYSQAFGSAELKKWALDSCYPVKVKQTQLQLGGAAYPINSTVPIGNRDVASWLQA